jgi:nucleotide-binding universal stress UspA family protein
MFKHILIPTDGSRLAAKGVKAGMKLAKALGARVTGVYVVPPYLPATYGELGVYAQSDARRNYKKNSERAAKKALAAVQIEAQVLGVPCTTRFVSDPQPWGAILRVARSAKCDAIAMSSHGRGALGGLLLGSQTQRVLAHAKIPVLVTR